MKASPASRIFLLILVSVFLAATAVAQSTSTIQGTVMDQSGAAVAGATVTVRNAAISLVRTTTTDSTGRYVVPSLPTGSYQIEVSAQGLAKQIADKLTVEVATIVTQNFSLKVASASETVEISAEAPVVESSTMSVGQVINQRTVQEIPLNGRHFVDLGLLIPGSVTPPANGFLTAPLRGQGSFQFNTAGQREDTVNFMINGINLNDMVQNQITFQPSINTVQEFKVDNSTYSAESGRNSGAIVNIATRGGSNAWHGEGFEFVRNDYFDARNFFNKAQTARISPFKRNQFGASVGGPIWKDHTFFFFSYEGLRQRQGVTINTRVPSNTERATASSPVTQQLLTLIPTANDATGLRFIGSGTAPVDIDQWTGDVSHNFRDSDRMHVYYAIQRDRRGEPILQGNNIPGFGDTRQSRRQILTINETHVFSPTLVNEARLGFNRIHITFTPNAQLNPTDFGIGNGVSTSIGIPQFNITDIGLNFGGPAQFPQGRGDLTAVLSDTLTWTHGKHNLKVGGEFRRFSNNNFTGDTGLLTFATTNFGGQVTGLQHFLRGEATAFRMTPGTRPSRIYTGNLGGFVQDNWKLRSNLTLELGLRYDWNQTPTEAEGRFVVFDPATVNLVPTNHPYDQNALNFQPRLGIAWDVFGTGKTIVRSGYGLNVDQPVTNAVTPLASNPPSAIPINFTASQTIPALSISNLTAGAASLAPTTIASDFRNAYVQSYNLNVQQQVSPTFGVMVGYFGSKGTNLRYLANINQRIGSSTGPRPFPTLSGSTVPGFPATTPLSLINQVTSGANSNYNALWLSANKRMSHGVQFNASYTYSKSLDYNSQSSQAIVPFQNSYDPRANYGPSDFDARHRAVLNGIYDLPFKGNRLVEGWEIATILQLQTGNPITILTGKNFTDSTNLRPIGIGSVTMTNDLILSGPNAGLVQWFSAVTCTIQNFAATPGCVLLDPTVGTSAANTITTFGDVKRNALTGPDFKNMDFSIIKNTKVTERLTTQFRVEAFNVFNHPNFAPPSTPGTIGTVMGGPTTTFGVINSTRFPTGDSGSSRQLQFALKLLF